MRRASLAILALALTAPLSSPGDAWADEGATAGVRTFPFEDGARTDVLLPGSLVAYAVPAGDDGQRHLMLLITPREYVDEEEEETEGRGARKREEKKKGKAKLPPCDGPGGAGKQEDKALYRVDRAAGELVAVRTDIPGDATGIEAVDLDGDGVDELLILRPNEVLLVADEGVGVLLEDEGLLWKHAHPTLVRAPALGAAGLLSVVRNGMLTLYGPDYGGGLHRVAETALPIESDLQGRRLTLRHAVPRFIGSRPDDDVMLFATASDGFGGRRLRTLVAELRPGGEPFELEAWAALPEAEEVMERHFLILDGEPVLMVTTRPADKLVLFGEKRIRIFPLKADRSHLGLPPLFATESKMNLWQESTAVLADVDRDGDQDLVLGYWTGLIDAAVAVDVYLRDADGGFRAKPRTTSFDVPEANRDFLHYGSDMDGDGLADLLVLSDQEVLLYPGLPSKNGKKIVDWRYFRVPRGARRLGSGGVEIDFGDGEAPWRTLRVDGTPRVIDLDADGTSEALMIRRGGASVPGAVRIVSFAR